MNRKRCANCNQLGHLYKQCKNPMNSYGIILYRLNPYTKHYEYLLIQRRNTFAYVEILRGNFSFDEDYIKRLLGEMTHDERHALVTKSFQELWDELWLQEDKTNPRFIRDFKKGKKIFEENFKFISDIHETVPILWEIPEWGFPKGKKEMHESVIECAKRECSEETNIRPEQYTINFELSPLEELFVGTDGKTYRHLYYVAEFHDHEHMLAIDSSNLLQMREVGNMKWFTLNDANQYIRPYNQEKKDLLKYVQEEIVKKKIGF